MKKAFAIILTALLTVLFVMSVYASETARSIVIFEIEGGDVTMTKGTSRSFKASVNQKMANGYTITTGNDSYCWLKLDENSLVKMDQNSTVQFGNAKSNKLSISVLSGAITVNAAAQNPGNSVEVRAGNSALAIRGTSFVVENLPGDRVIITMLTGDGDVIGMSLDAGKVMYIYDTQEKKVFETHNLVIDENLSLPVLEAILKDIADMIEAGVMHAADADYITEYISALVEKKQAENDANFPETTEIENEIIRLGQSETTGGHNNTEDDGNGDSGYTPPTDIISQINNAQPDSVIEISQPTTIGTGQNAILGSGVTLNITSSLTINGTLTVEADANLHIANGATVHNTSGNTWNIIGTVYNGGIINNTNTGIIHIYNDGTFVNNGVFNNMGGFVAVDGAVIVLEGNGSVTESVGHFYDKDGTTLIAPPPNGMYRYRATTPAGWVLQSNITQSDIDIMAVKEALEAATYEAALKDVANSSDAEYTVNWIIEYGNSIELNDVTIEVTIGAYTNYTADGNGLIAENGGYDFTITLSKSGGSTQITNTLTLILHPEEAAIGTNHYLTLANALAAANQNDTVELIVPVTIETATVIPADVTLKIANAGLTVYAELTNNGTILVEGTGLNSLDIGGSSVESGTFMNNGTIYNTGEIGILTNGEIVNTGTLDSTEGSIEGTLGTPPGQYEPTITITSGSVIIGETTYTSTTLIWSESGWTEVPTP